MDSSKIIAILTGAIAIILSLAYLLLVQLLDFRGEMVPAPDLSVQPVQPQLSQPASVWVAQTEPGKIQLTLN